MISPIAQSLNAAYGVRDLPGPVRNPPGHPSGGLPKVSDVEKPGGLGPVSSPARPAAASFTDMIGTLVQEVDGKAKASETEARNLMLGQTDNLHQSMIAMQESGLAFTLLVEVRNKLVESYQELMRMPV